MGLEQLPNLLKEDIERIRKHNLDTLFYAGEEAINYARQGHTNDWTDRTGNLRSSIGYSVVAENGSVEKEAGFNGSPEGSSEGKKVVQRAKNKAQKGQLTLILVAGMNYATYVERKGRDVLAGAKLKAENVLDDLLRKVK